MRETPDCSSGSMRVRSCSATLVGAPVVVGDLLSDATAPSSNRTMARAGPNTSRSRAIESGRSGSYGSRPAIIPRSLMTDNLDNLILDLLEWLGSGQRPYLEVLDAWRTSCPRFPVWEDANDRGFIERHYSPGRGQYVSVSAAGAEHLRKYRSQSVTDVEPLSV